MGLSEKIKKMKECRKCGLIKENSEFRIRNDYMREGKPIERCLYTYCRECEKLIAESTAKAKKDAPPQPSCCDMCGKYGVKLFLDHCHKTDRFRGWLCNNCNRGLGFLGDDIESLEVARRYLIKTS